MRQHNGQQWGDHIRITLRELTTHSVFAIINTFKLVNLYNVESDLFKVHHKNAVLYSMLCVHRCSESYGPGDDGPCDVTTPWWVLIPSTIVRSTFRWQYGKTANDTPNFFCFSSFLKKVYLVSHKKILDQLSLFILT